MDWLELLLIVGLFLVGLRASAFFSGSETGFYRLSLPRLGIDAQSGERAAQHLLWFARHPAYFVATTLVGNNIANYITTMSIGLGVVWLFSRTTDLLEVGATLFVSPIIFLFGELLPKNIYYRSPMALMEREVWLFRLVFWLTLPLTWPLVQLNRLLERVSGTVSRPMELLLGRSRLVQMLGHGHHEGVLTTAQSRLANGVLQIATQAVDTTMTPSARVFGVDDSANRDEVLRFAKKYGVAIVAVCRAQLGRPDDWYAYYLVSEVATTTRPLTSCKRVMPRLPVGSSKLEALRQLHAKSVTTAAVVGPDGTVLGLVSERGLIEQLFSPSQATHQMVARDEVS
ncbi:MAG: CNNM domain-containing protein [Planctomycetaceae bacterium]